MRGLYKRMALYMTKDFKIVEEEGQSRNLHIIRLSHRLKNELVNANMHRTKMMLGLVILDTTCKLDTNQTRN
jgi:hypothetical protein